MPEQVLNAIKKKLYADIIATDPGGTAPDIIARVDRTRKQGASFIQVTDIIGNLSKYTEASIKLAVLESLELIIQTTPIDTTWASHSWFPGYGGAQNNGGYLIEPDEQRAFGEIDVSSGFGSYGGDPFDTLLSEEEDFENDAAAAFLAENDFAGDGETGSGEILSIEHEFKLQKRRDDQEKAIVDFAARIIFVNGVPTQKPNITNGVPYITELNDGKSKQTPRNFVQRALIVGLGVLEVKANTIHAAGRATRGI